MDSNNEQLDRLNLLYQKLKASQPQQTQGQKLKLRNVQSIIMKFYSEIEQSNLDRDNRLELLSDRLYRLQATLQDDMTKRQAKEKALSGRLSKIQKSYKKAVETLTKVRLSVKQERQQMDKKIQTNLEACLSDINTHKNKQQADCSVTVKEMLSLVPEVEDLQQQVQSQSTVTKEILKKIYNQFSQQIDELKEMINEEKQDREAEEGAIIKRLQQAYSGIHNNIINIKKSREKSEKMLVDLLERVIEKVKRQLSGD